MWSGWLSSVMCLVNGGSRLRLTGSSPCFETQSSLSSLHSPPPSHSKVPIRTRPVHGTQYSLRMRRKQQTTTTTTTILANCKELTRRYEVPCILSSGPACCLASSHLVSHGTSPCTLSTGPKRLGRPCKTFSQVQLGPSKQSKALHTPDQAQPAARLRIQIQPCVPRYGAAKLGPG